MWAIQSVANSLKMQEQNEEEPMDLLGSPNESSLEDMEVAGSKRCTRVVRPFDLFLLLVEVCPLLCACLGCCGSQGSPDHPFPCSFPSSTNQGSPVLGGECTSQSQTQSCHGGLWKGFW